MLVVRATKKLLDRVGGPTLEVGGRSTTLLGPWYASVLRGRPQLALLVNERTLVPVLMPQAPAATLLSMAASQIAMVLSADCVPEQIVSDEVERMREGRIAQTANRTVVGVMVEFTRLAAFDRDAGSAPDLLDLAVRLARTPCGPLYRRNVSPDRELAAVLRTIAIR